MTEVTWPTRSQAAVAGALLRLADDRGARCDPGLLRRLFATRPIAVLVREAADFLCEHRAYPARPLGDVGAAFEAWLHERQGPAPVRAPHLVVASSAATPHPGRSPVVHKTPERILEAVERVRAWLEDGPVPVGAVKARMELAGILGATQVSVRHRLKLEVVQDARGRACWALPASDATEDAA